MAIFTGTTEEVREAVQARVAKSAAAFGKQVQEFAKKLVPKQVVLFQRKLTLEALQRVVLKTPVDTGRARGNWQTSWAEPKRTPLATASSDPVAEGAVAVADLPPFNVVYITNNVDYIVFLENGSSRQAPAGMVTITIEELRQMFP